MIVVTPGQPNPWWVWLIIGAIMLIAFIGIGATIMELGQRADRARASFDLAREVADEELRARLRRLRDNRTRD
jgi:hypothetical protein